MAVFLVCATVLVIWLGRSVVPFLVVDMNLDDYRGGEERAIIDAVGEMHERKRGGLGTYRVTTWKVTSVEKCRTRCPPYAVELELFTLFGVPYGETGVYCGQPGASDGTGGRP